jgi:hypothetical protein
MYERHWHSGQHAGNDPPQQIALLRDVHATPCAGFSASIRSSAAANTG